MRASGELHERDNRERLTYPKLALADIIRGSTHEENEIKYLDAEGIFIFEETVFDEHYRVPEGT